MTTTAVATEAEIREALTALRVVAPPTPLVESASLTRLAGVPVFLKCEQWQPVGSFKIRGAWTAVSRLSPPLRNRGIVTHSSGNHGQAVAWVAARLGVPAVVVMPRTAPTVKLDAVRRHGAEVELVEPVSSARVARAEELARERGLTLIPPFDHQDVILGQATCAWEVLQQQADIKTFVVPVGGGGLLAGTALALRARGGAFHLVAVEPTGAPKLTAALAAGQPVMLAETRSIADGLLPLAIGRLPFEQIRPASPQVVQVSDDQILHAVRFLWETQGLRIEPSGAVGAAALLARALKLRTPTALLLTGGNVDPDRFAQYIA
jgi:threonine dehydratase